MEFVLLAKCADVAGISAAITRFVTESGGFIQESQQFGDPESIRFFTRIVFSLPDGEDGALERLRGGFAPVADRFAMDWTINDRATRPRTVIAVSRFGHCLNDLLHRWRTGSLPIDVACVVSNHPDGKELVEWHGLPYHHLPVAAATKARQEAKFRAIIEAASADLVVLARYMQVLSPDFASFLSGRCINIHHSFLPSFKGAKPYHQAFARGVKIIGATAHYVTDDLDEGPIIEQDVERVDHSWTVDKFVEAGRDIEARVLARAVAWHAEGRVLSNGCRTVVFR